MKQLIEPLIANEELNYEIIKGISDYTRDKYLTQIIKEEIKSRNKNPE